MGKIGQLFLMNGEKLVATIARSDDAVANDFLRHRPEVVSEAHPGEEINDHSGEIHGVVAQLGRLVVPGKDVVVVVPSFTQCCNGNRQVLCRIDVPLQHSY